MRWDKTEKVKKFKPDPLCPYANFFSNAGRQSKNILKN